MALQKLKTAEDLENAFREWNELLFKYVFVRIGSGKIAEDITQESFLKAWEKRESFDPEKSSLKNWLFVITINTMRDYFRTQKKFTNEILERVKEGAQEEDIMSGEDVRADVEKKDTTDFVLRQMGQLSERDQELLSLRYVEDLDIAEVAQVLKMEYSATKVAIHRALKKLKEICRDKV